MKAPAIPMRRSPTIPNPVPCTIWPASHPAMRPTTNTIRRLSPDMCLRILQLHQQADKFPPAQQTRNPSSKTAAAESDHSLLQGGLESLSPASKAPCQVKTVQ